MSITTKVIALIVTTKCTLRCKKCVLGIPYFKEQKHDSYRSIVAELDSIFKIYDAVERVDVSGGEALMHPDLIQIIAHIAEEDPINPKSEEYLIKIMDLAKQHGLPLLLIKTPADISESSQKRYNAVARLAKENGVEFINYNLMDDELGMDLSVDLVDRIHLSYFGSQKFSSYMAGFLKDAYALPDRRNDAAYAEWNIWAAEAMDYTAGVISALEEKRLSEATENVEQD